MKEHGKFHNGESAKPFETVLHRFDLHETTKKFLLDRAAQERGPWVYPDDIQKIYVEPGGRVVIKSISATSFYYPPNDVEAQPNEDVRPRRKDSHEENPWMKADKAIKRYGTSPEEDRRLRDLIKELDIKRGDRVLLVGPCLTPFQDYVAATGARLEIAERDREICDALAIHHEDRKEVTIANIPFESMALEADSLNFISVMNVLDLIPNDAEAAAFRKLLGATKHGGRIAIGHFEPLPNQHELETLIRTARSLGFGVVDLGIAFDEGHENYPAWKTPYAKVFQVYKHDIPADANQLKLTDAFGMARTLLNF